MSAHIAVWDWEREPVPDVRVAVCRPGLYSTPVGIEAADPRTCMLVHVVHGGAMVLPFEAHLMPSFRLRRGIIPALYAEQQADLSGVGALLAVNAERRALVLCPREAMDLADAFDRLVYRGDGSSGYLDAPGIDLVVIIPPPEAMTCVGRIYWADSHNRCSEGWHVETARGPRRIFGPAFHEPDEGLIEHVASDSGLLREQLRIDRHGGHVVDTWPVHPAWVRAVVEQCRAAGVPVAFLGWGRWLPWSQRPMSMALTREMLIRDGNAVDIGGEYAWPVGEERSGRLLGGAEVMDLPEWLT